MRRRGFTVTEMAICLSVLVVLVPVVYALATGLEEAHDVARWHMRCADELRTVAEELGHDARASLPVASAGVAFEVPGCQVRYRISEERVLLREAGEACGGTRALARDVASLRRQAGGVELVFARRARPSLEHRSTVFIPLEAP